MPLPVRFLSDAELARLSSWPDEIAAEDLVTFFTLSPDDLGWLAGFNRDENRLGAAVQLCALLTIMAAFAQLEHDTMIERTRAGLLAAAANGRKGGRPRKVDDADAAKARQLRQKGIAATDVAQMLGVSRATAYRYLNEDSTA